MASNPFDPSTYQPFGGGSNNYNTGQGMNNGTTGGNSNPFMQQSGGGSNPFMTSPTMGQGMPNDNSGGGGFNPFSGGNFDLKIPGQNMSNFLGPNQGSGPVNDNPFMNWGSTTNAPGFGAFNGMTGAQAQNMFTQQHGSNPFQSQTPTQPPAGGSNPFNDNQMQRPNWWSSGEAGPQGSPDYVRNPDSFGPKGSQQNQKAWEDRYNWLQQNQQTAYTQQAPINSWYQQHDPQALAQLQALANSGNGSYNGMNAQGARNQLYQWGDTSVMPQGAKLEPGSAASPSGRYHLPDGSIIDAGTGQHLGFDPGSPGARAQLAQQLQRTAAGGMGGSNVPSPNMPGANPASNRIGPPGPNFNRDNTQDPMANSYWGAYGRYAERPGLEQANAAYYNGLNQPPASQVRDSWYSDPQFNQLQYNPQDNAAGGKNAYNYEIPLGGNRDTQAYTNYYANRLAYQKK